MRGKNDEDTIKPIKNESHWDLNPEFAVVSQRPMLRGYGSSETSPECEKKWREHESRRDLNPAHSARIFTPEWCSKNKSKSAQKTLQKTSTKTGPKVLKKHYKKPRQKHLKNLTKNASKNEAKNSFKKHVENPWS